MKTGYIIVVENNAKYGPATEVGTSVYRLLKIAQIRFKNKIKKVEKNPNSYFGLASKNDLRYKWITDRYIEIKDSFSGDIINIYIHEVKIL